MPTHFRGETSLVRALDAYIKLSRASDSLDSKLAAALAREGLTTGQLGVLEALLHLGPLSQTEICRKLLRSGSNVTTVIDNLERQRLVRRKRRSDDRRVIGVELTAEGRRLIARIFPGHARRIAEAMNSLTAAEQAELGRLCRKLGLALAGSETQARKNFC